MDLWNKQSLCSEWHVLEKCYFSYAWKGAHSFMGIYIPNTFNEKGLNIDLQKLQDQAQTIVHITNLRPIWLMGRRIFCNRNNWWTNDWNYYDKINSLSHFYKPTTFTVDDNIQQFSLPSTFAGRPYYNSFNV